MDQWLDDAAEGAEHLLLVLILQLARLMVWLSRRVLRLLMMIGHACSCVLLRQMEFDADLHETRLAGSETFGSTSRELQRLGFAYGEAMNRAGRAHRDGRLPDDIPALTRFERKRAKPETIGEIDKQAQAAKTGFFDTHPCDAERIARAETDAALGSKMFVGRDLIGQLVLLHGSGISGCLRRPGGVLANFVFEIFRHCFERCSSACRPTGRNSQITKSKTIFSKIVTRRRDVRQR